MSIEDDVKVCTVLRNFKSDSEYLHFGDFWIEELTEEDKNRLSDNLKHFVNFWEDNYVAVRWYYIGRGKSSSVLADNARLFIFPFFRALKLFRTGDLITPLGFYFWKERWHESKFHGDSYGLGYGLKGNPYIFNKDDVEPFNAFREQLEEYLRYITFVDVPYRKKPDIFKEVDVRCFFAIHLLLKGSLASNNPFLIIDKLVDYTMGLESLCLDRRDDLKRSKIASRISAVLGRDETEREKISGIIKRFYDIRSDVVHASLIDDKDDSFLGENIYVYEDIFRRSVLAFLDLNLRDPSKEVILNTIDRALEDRAFMQEIHNSLKLLRLSE